jgi:DNA-binding CsgD family transcriptional regulator
MRSKAANRRECSLEPSVAELVAALVRQTAEGKGGAADESLLLDVEIDGVRCVMRRVQSAATRPLTLSPREQEIARMVARGYPNKTIAAVLDISTWTVGTYLRRIFAKYGVTSRAAMVAKMMSVVEHP